MSLKELPNSKELGSEGSASETTSLSAITYTAEEERAVVRKIDWALLPGLTFLYLLSFLDRSNVGNARAMGLLTDIGIKDASVYSTSLALYFIGYCVFEVPANMILKKFNPKVWLPTCTVVWGIVATLQALVKNEAGFLVARFAMGVSEAGLFPGCVFVFSMYYKRNERHWRVAAFFGGAAIAGAFGGVLAWAIGHMKGIRGLEGWQWLFILEGAFTILVGLSAYYWVPSYPRQATFLTEREKEILLARLGAASDSADDEPFSYAGVKQALVDPYVYLYAFLFMGFAFPLYSLSLFLPTIISGLGYASWQAQLLTVPPYAVAFLSILLFAWSSHVHKQRGSHIAVGGAVAILGYIVLLTTHTPGARYAGLFIAVIGIYASNSLLLSWPSENVSPQTKRATASAAQICIGDFGAVAGVLIYRPSLAGNFYRVPHIIALCFALGGILIALFLWARMGADNRQRAAKRAETGQHELHEIIREGERRVGDKHVSYTYQI